MSRGYSLEMRTPWGRSSTDCHGESPGTATMMRTGLLLTFEYCSSPRRHDVAAGLLDPVTTGDAHVEQAVGQVRRDLLRAQDADAVDPRVVDGGLVGRPPSCDGPARSAASKSSSVAFSSDPLGSTSFNMADTVAKRSPTSGTRSPTPTSVRRSARCSSRCSGTCTPEVLPPSVADTRRAEFDDDMPSAAAHVERHLSHRVRVAPRRGARGQRRHHVDRRAHRRRGRRRRQPGPGSSPPGSPRSWPAPGPWPRASTGR